MKNPVEDTLRSLIAWNKEINTAQEHWHKNLSRVQVYYFMKTIQLRLARAAGHTTAILQIADPETDLIICSNKVDATVYRANGFNPIYIRDFLEGKYMAIKRDAYKKVFVDSADHIFTNVNIWEFYEKIARFDIEVIVLLG
jgi:hypothetical protein